MWAVTGKPGETGSEPKSSATVRRVAVEGQPPISVPGTLVADATSTAKSFGMVTVSSPIEGLTPLPITETAPTTGDQVLMAAMSSDDFAVDAPSVSIVEGSVTDRGGSGFGLSVPVTSNDVGTTVLTPDGLVIGLMPSSKEPWTTLPAELRAYATANGAEPMSAYPEPEDESGSMWIWLGPVIGVAALAVIGGVVFIIVRGRRKKALASAMAGFPSGGVAGQFGQQQFGQQAQQFGQQTPHPQQFGQPQQYGQQQYGQQPSPQQYGTPAPQQTPPPASYPQQTPPPAAPGSYDQTQIGQRPPTPPQ